MEWLLDKYEERVDMTSGFGKKEYSDVALKMLDYVKDKVERAHYEELVARRLGVSREDLRGKEGDLERKMLEKPKRRLKKAKTEAKSNAIVKLEDNLLAIMVYGGVEGPEELEIPEDETKLSELELVFDNLYKNYSKAELTKEVKSLYRRLKKELTKSEIAKLMAELEAEDLAPEREKEILRKITELQKT